MNEPDTYTLAWWRQQFRGVQHSLNRCNAEYESAYELILELKARITTLEKELQQTKTDIGKLQDEMHAKLDKIREVYLEIKNEHG